MRLDDPMFEKMKAAQENYHPKAMSIPGVHATSVGVKQVAGELTETIAIRIYLTKKRPIDEVPVDERIPEEIDGFPTDVVESEQFVAFWDETKYRPVVGGCLIATDWTYGTLGCVVKDLTTGNYSGLSNQHVLNSSNGAWVCNPNTLEKSGIGTQTRTVLSTTVDGGILAFFGPGNRYPVDWRPEIVEIGRVVGSFKVTSIPCHVRKRGARTGLSEGDIVALNRSGTRTDGWQYTGQYSIMGKQGQDFALGGDSGSVVVDNMNRVVGLLWGGTPDGRWGAASPIMDVRSQLKIEVVTTHPSPSSLSHSETLEGQLQTLLSQSERGRQYWHAYRGHYSVVEHMFHIIPRLHATWLKLPQDELIAAVRSGIMDPVSKIPATLGSEDTAKVLETLRGALAGYLDGDGDPATSELPKQVNSLFDDIAANIGGSWRDAISDKQPPR